MSPGLTVKVILSKSIGTSDTNLLANKRDSWYLCNYHYRLYPFHPFKFQMFAPRTIKNPDDIYSYITYLSIHPSISIIYWSFSQSIYFTYLYHLYLHYPYLYSVFLAHLQTISRSMNIKTPNLRMAKNNISQVKRDDELGKSAWLLYGEQVAKLWEKPTTEKKNEQRLWNSGGIQFGPQMYGKMFFLTCSKRHAN